jgi:hypothetical protein
MRQHVEITGRTYDVGLVTFETNDGAEMDFAHALSKEWGYDGDVYLVLGCRWAAAMAGEPRVIAAVRTGDGELEEWVETMTDKYAEYGVRPIGSYVRQYFKDGQLAAAGWDGGP